MCRSAGCNEEAGKSGKCSMCNAAAVRVSRKLSGLSQEDRDVLSTLGEEERTEFNQKARSAIGKDLDILIQHTLKSTVDSYEQEGFIGTGEFYDMCELEDKYKNNPLRLKAVKELGERFVCPKTKIEMIEDMRYQRRVESGTRHSESSTSTAETTQQKLKKARVEKPKPKAEPAKGAVDEPTPLSDANAASLQKVKDQVEAAAKVVEEHEVEIEDPDGQLKAMMPKYVLDGALSAKVKASQQVNVIDMVLANKSCLDFKALVADAKDTVKTLKDAAKDLKLQIAAAKKKLTKT